MTTRRIGTHSPRSTCHQADSSRSVWKAHPPSFRPSQAPAASVSGVISALRPALRTRSCNTQSTSTCSRRLADDPAGCTNATNDTARSDTFRKLATPGSMPCRSSARSAWAVPRFAGLCHGLGPVGKARGCPPRATARRAHSGAGIESRLGCGTGRSSSSRISASRACALALVGWASRTSTQMASALA